MFDIGVLLSGRCFDGSRCLVDNSHIAACIFQMRGYFLNGTGILAAINLRPGLACILRLLLDPARFQIHRPDGGFDRGDIHTIPARTALDKMGKETDVDSLVDRQFAHVMSALKRVNQPESLGLARLL